MTKRIITLFLALTICINLCSCALIKHSVDIDEQDIKAICEITTLKCYYNNVAKIHKEANNIFQKDRDMWIEYEGYAELSFNASELNININGDEITIEIPNVNVKVNYTKETLNEDSYICSTDGLLFKNKVTAEEQMQAIEQAQQEMKKEVETNSSLQNQAISQLESVIRNFINKIAEAQNAKEPCITFK